ncbi:hypothetical protein HU200_008444 [Digitaria exilis]|uniref:Uncharacterized protein n=1 Tax=Digitaria exilis TaxID=1010633 RepID=A0A835KQ65_9POAL|nr:hypothetical protein HU200_008444 [Digitaria exilis]
MFFIIVIRLKRLKPWLAVKGRV